MTIRPHMFSKIFDFRYQRTPLQACGFYLAQVIVYILISGLFLALLQISGVIDPVANIAAGMPDPRGIPALQAKVNEINPYLGLAHALFVIGFMLKAKNMERNRKMVLIGAAGIVLGGVWGAPASLIIASYLSTRPVAPLPAKG